VDKDGRCAEPITATLCAGAVIGTAFFLSETVAYLSSDPDGNGQSVASEIGTATAQLMDNVKTAAVDYYARQAVALLSAGVTEGEVSPNTALVHDVPERGSDDHPADTDLNRPRIDTTPIVESLPGRMETPYHDKSPEEYILSTPSRAGDIDSGLMLATAKSGSVAPGELDVAKYGPNDPPVRIDGDWSVNDIKAALLGHPPKGLGKPDLHHADQMPGSAIHEILPELHRGNKSLHPNKFNQGVTPEMRDADRKLHWWYRAREQGADDALQNWIYD
jgi:hypothetical protein